MPMTYTDHIQNLTIMAKMRAVVEAMAELAGDNDEALDTHGREAEINSAMELVEWIAPAWLSFYSSSGTGVPFQDRLIERHEEAQAAEWARQYPSRASLFACAADDGGEHQEEAHEWLDAALQEEAIFLALGAHLHKGMVEIRAAFTDEINAPVGGKRFERKITQEDFLALEGDELEALVVEAIDTAYSGANE